MRKLLKSYLLLNRIKYFILSFICPVFFQAQIVNYVNNGGFEKIISSMGSPRAQYWRAIDSTKYFGNTLTEKVPPFEVPLSSYTYQWPKGGYNYFISGFFYYSGVSIRGYPLNVLKDTLVSGKTYCVKFYCNITNESSYGIGCIGAYFGNSQLDTITHCTQALTYLSPQVQNPTGNVITDTLNWVPITGTFVANGTEKYMVLGNFKSDASTDTVLINPTHLPTLFCDVLLDDVSCIDIDLPAFAGRDTSVIPGDSVFLGREPDVGIDEACMWYKLPTVITPTTPALDTVAGFWLKPVSNCTFVVRQQLWCSGVKWDTVVVHLNPVGIEKLKMLNEELKIYPIPAKDFIELSIYNEELIKEFHSISIFNNLGVLLREEEIKFENEKLKINTEDLPNGVYSLLLKNNSKEIVSKRFVIAR